MLPPPPPPLSSSSAVGGRRLLPLDLEGVEESTLVEVEALWRTFCWMGGLLPAQANAVPPTAAAPPTIVLPASPAAKARLKLKKAPGDRGPDDSQGAAEKTTPHAQLDPALSATGMQRDASAKRPLGVNDLFEVFNRLEHKATKAEVEDMIWEADDNLDGRVSWDEILILYRRCINDKTGFEPRQLFTLVQFLMYDSDFTGRITVEQTLQILFVRCGRELLDQEIRAIFGDDERAANGEEKRIGYTEFLGRINARLHKLRNAKKVVSYPKAHQTARQRQDRSRPA
eukprot:GHVT01091152.1.p1 GENE.GHVT01091152.1~~GHVT01091152.1.p1  ORF type:complete len:311 (+),score=86.86 GHVT01091152.1:80-934(+)